MTILNEILKSSPSSIIDLYQVDFNPIGVDSTHYIAPGSNSLGNNITFNGTEYLSLPLELVGIEWNGSGQLPNPKLTLGNIGGGITYLNLAYQDLLGVKITRIRTMYKFLDAVNFSPAINPDADPSAIFPIEVYYVDRKISETNSVVEYELVSALDISSVKLPRRLIIQNMCTWRYKSAECNYTGTNMFTDMGVATLDPLLDQCGKKLSDCKARFGANEVLNYGGFPGAGLFK